MIVKRYANRKLYDTEAGRYVTLDEIGDAIRRGDEVTVKDHATGADLTAVTLMQVIYEREKKVGGMLPKAILTGLIQTGSSAVSSLRSGLTSLLDNSPAVETEIRRRLKILLDDGLIAAEEFHRFTELLISPRFRPRPPSDTPVDEDTPTADEVQNLVQQIDDLERQIAEAKASRA